MSADRARPLLLHGSCVALKDGAVLLRGPSGSGKSDLTLRLIDGGAALVADDYVEITRKGEVLWAASPAKIAGLLEVRGAGIIAIHHIDGAALRLIVDLVAPERVERLPGPGLEIVLGLSMPRFALAPFEASAPAKIRAILDALNKAAFRTDLTE
jgi:HPr kinase/phosphorylase